MKYLYHIIVFFIFCSGCSKYLDKKPDETQSIPSNISDLQALLDNTNRMNIQRTPNFGEASCDDYFLLDATYNQSPIERQQIYTWQRGDYFFQNDWSFAYETIYTANYCIDQLNLISMNASNIDQWKNIHGAALFFRSFHFLNLLWVYAKAYDESTADTDLGIVLRLESDFNIPSIRSNVKDCYFQVLADAKEAAAELPNHSLNVMRPSKAAAYGLIARTYLSMRIYDSAYKYSDLALHISSELMDYNSDSNIQGSIYDPIPFNPFNKEIVFYTEMITTNFINAPYRAKIDTVLYSLYNDNDLRKNGFFEPNSGYYQFKGSYTSNNSQYFTGIATDELYLMRAECLVRAGKIPEGMDDLNALLIKRWNNTTPFIPLTASDIEHALQIALKERRKELYMRGLRWMDIKRLNKEGANIALKRIVGGQTYTLASNANYYALPLPADIIEQTGIQQNEK